MEIVRGTKILVRAANGDWLPRRAVTGIEPGDRFPVIWVCREEEWAEAKAEGREPEIVPWPADEVREAEEARA